MRLPAQMRDEELDSQKAQVVRSSSGRSGLIGVYIAAIMSAVYFRMASLVPSALLGSICMVVGAQCGGPTVGPMPPLGAATTNATLVGRLCKDQQCRCRDNNGGTPQTVGLPPAGMKRFEVRIGPVGNELRVQVGTNKLYKSSERPVECFYVDLAPGRHSVSLRASGEPAFGANFSISEMGPSGKHWYDTFWFRCGINVCSLQDVIDWKTETARLGAAHDPCGSTKVSAIHYQTGRLPDGIHPADLFVEATLEVYKFTPAKPPCRLSH